MSAPQTPFEINNRWTTLSEEDSFMQSLDGVGGSSIEILGWSVEENKINCFTIGNSSNDNVVFIGALQHGDEPAPRESAFALMRDLAYRVEPWMSSYLNNHTVVIVPTMNPDRWNQTRNNANNVNLNRDWFKLEQPETLSVISKLGNIDDLDIIMDAHETSGQPGADWRPFPAGYVTEYYRLEELANDFIQETESVLSTEGWSTLLYPKILVPLSGLSTMASTINTIGLLSETVSVDTTDTLRVNISHMVFKELLTWHRDNLSEIKQAKNNAKADASLPTETTFVPTTEYDRGARVFTDAIGYVPSEVFPQKYLETFNIEVGSDGFISLEQPSRLVIVALLDYRSREMVIEATSIFSDSKDLKKQLAFVEVSGVRYPVKAIVVEVDGVRYVIKNRIIEVAGVRYE